MSLSQNKGSVEPQLKSQSSTLELKASGIITRIPLNKDAPLLPLLVKGKRPYPDPYPNPNIDHDAINNQNVPQQDDTTEEEGLEQSQVKPPLRMPQDQSKSESDLEPEEEPLLITYCNPDESHETILWKRIMAEKDQRQREYRIIQRKKRQLSRLQTENEN
jgi:hypothetical protein